jgi:hypothetical protein
MIDRLREKIACVTINANGLFTQLQTVWSCRILKRTNLRLEVRSLIENYHAWSMGSQPLIKANLPESADRFEELYNEATGCLAIFIDDNGDLRLLIYRKFEQIVATQVGIVRSIPDAFEAKALGLRGILARDLFEDELIVARHLLENGYVREGGVIAGVVLEHHLKGMCEKRNVILAGKETLGELNNKLREHYPDDSEYRRVQWMNEIRATCTHEKSAPPDSGKVSQLVSAVGDFMASIS